MKGSWAVRFRRAGFATVALVGLLSFGMPTAQAFDVGPIIEDIVGIGAAGGGIGVMSAPEDAAVTAVCATGVGCAVLGAAALGVGLYMTHDTWIPWVKNAFGAAGDGSSGRSCGTRFCLEFAQTPVVGAHSDNGASTGFILHTTWSTDWRRGSYTPEVVVVVSCLSPLGYAYNAVKDMYTQDMGTDSANDGNGNTTYSGCPNHNEAGDWAQGHIVGIALQDPEPYAVEGATVLTWGTPIALDDSNTVVSNKVDCVNPDGSTYEVTQAVTGITGSLAPLPTCVGAPLAQPGAHGVCVTTSAGAIGGPLVPQSSTCPANGTMAALYPNCVGGGHACTYVVKIDGLACTVGRTECINWEDTAATNPSRVACDYGAYAVPLANCVALKRIYETGTTTGTLLNTDNNPGTYSAPGPGGQTVDQSTPSPSPTPSGSGSASPTPTPNPTQAPGTIASPSGPQTAAENDCWPSGWGMFNPGSWVLQPVKCALSWAFVPSAVFLDSWSGGVKDNWGRSPFGHWLGAIGGFAALNIPSAGCRGPGLPTGLLGSGFGAMGAITAPTIYPFDACSGVMATVAATSNLVLTAGISFFGGMRVVQQLGYAFGFKINIGSEIQK